MKAGFTTVWHDQFKTAVLANAAAGDWSDGVMENWNDAPEAALPNNPTIQQSITPFLPGVVEIDFNLANGEGVNMNPEGFRGYSRRKGDTDFKFLACRAEVRRRRVPGKPELREGLAGSLREYIPTRRDVGGDVEVSQFSNEITVNCAPLV